MNLKTKYSLNLGPEDSLEWVFAYVWDRKQSTDPNSFHIES